jgi:signal transduction histidine kinase/ligand-binding sensor domain-containing protein/CheY-like chemotaxis protein
MNFSKLSSFTISIISYFVFLVYFTNSYGQKTVYFETISTKEGLSQSDVNAIYQDKQGFLWFATHDGLNRYDGYDFKVYKPNPNKKSSISSNLIFDIVEDKNGNLWIGTTGGGLNCFDKKKNTFISYKHQENNKNSLSNDYITSLYIDKSNHLWIATDDGLNVLDIQKTNPKNIEFKHFSTEGGNLLAGWNGSINKIYEDSKNQMWVGSFNGLYKLSHDQNGGIYFKLVNKEIGLPETIVYTISEDKFGRLLIGNAIGLYCQVSSKSANLSKVYEGQVNEILINTNNSIWLGTNDGVVCYGNADNTKLPAFINEYKYDPMNPNSLTKNIVKSMYKDTSGIIWIGTNGGGLNKFNPERKQFKLIKKTANPNSLSYDKIRTIFEDSNGTLWIGTEGGGLNFVTKKNQDGEYKNFKIIKTIRKPFAITEIKSGARKTILIGAEGFPSLYSLDISNPDAIITSGDLKPIMDVKHSVFALLEDKQNNVWIGTYANGVYRWLWDKVNKRYIKDKLTYQITNPNGISNNIIRNIVEDIHGNIWFATANGLCKLSASEINKQQPKFKIFKHDESNQNSISHNYVLAVFESSNGTIWIGTFGGGLNKLLPKTKDSPEKFISYSEANGLPNNVIKGILEDEYKMLWVSTNQGLSKFDPVQKTFKNYDVNDGLQSSEFQELACLKRKSEEMIFGGVNGFNAFFPNEIKDNIFPAETVITNFSISNKKINTGENNDGKVILDNGINYSKSLALDYDENSFSFEFAALHYASPEKNKFAYRLKGFEEQWIYTNSKRRFANYTNVPSGDYTFQVKSSNGDGLWDKTGKEIKITISPPFWKTLFAYFIYGVLAIILLIGFWRYTIISIDDKHQLKLEHIENEKQEQLQKIKLDFFTNISHELKTPLTLIKGPLDYLQSKGDQLNQIVVQEQYALMSKNTNALLRLINQLLDFRKINQSKMRLVVRNTNIIAFIKEVAEPFEFLAHKQQINFSVIATSTVLYSWFDHSALEKIMNNLLSNAFKFTPEKGEIMVSISEVNKLSTSNQVVIEVKDTGSGIPKKRLEKIFESYYIETDNNKRNPDGIGIGLSFTKSLIDLHQGTIDVESSSENGTVFTVKLPVEKEFYMDIPEISCKDITDNDFLARSSEIDSFAIDKNDEIVDEHLSKSRSKLPIVLIVDDNEDIRTFIKQTLQESYTICEAEDGAEGFEMANDIIPNIVITDLLMPIMNGIELCEKLKTNINTSHIPVIILTAKTSQENEIEGLKNGADDYIRKPFDMESLELKLKNILKQRQELRRLFNRDTTLNPVEITVTSTDERFLKQAIEIVEKHMMNTDFNVEMMVKEMGHSRSNLYLKFKELTGLSSSEFIRNIRLKRAIQLFESSDLSVKEIMYMTGFNTASYFAKCFKKQYGVKPSEYISKKDM